MQPDTTYRSDHSFHRWTLDDIAFDRIEPERVSDDPVLFQLLTSSSFVEIDTPLYAHSLAEFCHDDQPFADWVLHSWQPEEVRHGEALRRYVTTAWPEYDWERAYRSFHEAYLPLCNDEVLQPTLSLEMISRCVVEVGTSTYYGMIDSYAREPVLKSLASHIRADEVHHYQRFLETFHAHRDEEGSGRLGVMKAMLERFRMIRDTDAVVAYRYVLEGLPPAHPFRDFRMEQLEPHYAAMAREHYPFGMATLMLLKPLHLAAPLKKPLVPLIAATGRWYVSHASLQGLAHE
ncbi:MAG TPA: ferritin-like domain-containing protein [bacterium]|nr:ferritin-like domain-containing protein [bacterium]